MNKNFIRRIEFKIIENVMSCIYCGIVIQNLRANY